MPKHPTIHALEYWAINYRRRWRGTVISGILTPIVFMVGMGFGLGALVDTKISGSGQIGGVDYVVFIAPGLLVWAAMQTAVGESTWPVTTAAFWERTYAAMIAAPLRVRDVFLGHLLWICVRITMVSTAFLLAGLLLGAISSWSSLFALPAALLTGIACASVTMAFAVRQVSAVWYDAVFRVIVLPLFLFSGIFFPIEQMPALLRPLAYATPLWHGVELCRGLVIGHVEAGALTVHVLYLFSLTALGLFLAVRSYQRVLTK
ncbi:ABC transporter permease [Streptosporangium sp. NBC_01755]|uniref:ABC transporter permease n=1 Tax=unclassified Streptosporangium TaxID=2632669 RepID=UPI002DDA001A|nr:MULTISPECIES: ABC transporter permease [unclassified Streptosporangium]WSA26711.1 ABC transporter permease [Streptosporangium sp. NBC_01810]WSD01865.1 ABC transporter permease [Streptosporangium sp. NBC_01755]